MNELERALRRGRDTEEGARRASERFLQQAERDGLLDVAYATLDSPVGLLLVAATKRGLVQIAYDDGRLPERALERLAERISPRVLERPARLDDVRRQLDDYFEGRRTGFELPLDWRLTRGFNQRVLRRTAQIPFGAVSTYMEVAAAAGSPRGARAAGNALGANPIPIVVPCHRVLHSGGGLGGYGGGLGRKQFLLRLEGALGSKPRSTPRG